MTRTARIHNPSAAPVVYDGAGHLLDPFTATDAERGDIRTERLIASGRLVVQDAPAEPETVHAPETEPEPAAHAAKPRGKRNKDTVTNSGNGTETGE